MSRRITSDGSRASLPPRRFSSTTSSPCGLGRRRHPRDHIRRAVAEGWIVELSIAAVVLITVVNLRGVRESGIAFAIPTYLFILAYLAMMGAGIGKCALGTCPVAMTPDAIPAGAGAVTFFVLLRAFASGSAALTGIEAISNGVSAFRHPRHGTRPARSLSSA